MNHTKLPAGTYLVFGPALPPQVHILTQQAREHLAEGERIARASSDPALYLDQVRRQAFGVRGVAHVVPAWSLDAMQLIATNYTGDHETAVRGIAAAIALGRPFSRDQDPKGPQGGEKAPVSKGPKRPKGGAGALPEMFATLGTPA